MYRVFDNPNKLDKETIKNRIPLADDIQTYEYINDSGITLHYVKVDSSLTDVQINDNLVLPETDAEKNANTRKTNAINEAKLAIELKTLTPAQAVNYVDTYVTSLATAKIVLKIMVRLLIAIANKVFSELPEL